MPDVSRRSMQLLTANVARSMGLPPALGLALVEQESSFRPASYKSEVGWYDRTIAPKRSRWGASPIYGQRKRWGSYGLTQVLASTAYGLGYPLTLDPRVGGVVAGKAWPPLTDPEFSLRLGFRYYLQQLARYRQFRNALRRYNGSLKNPKTAAYADRVLGRVAKYLRAGWV